MKQDTESKGKLLLLSVILSTNNKFVCFVAILVSPTPQDNLCYYLHLVTPSSGDWCDWCVVCSKIGLWAGQGGFAGGQRCLLAHALMAA